MSKDFLYPLRRFHGWFHEWCLECKRLFALWKDITFPQGNKIYILGTPLHSNIGDSAIVLAQRAFLMKSGVPDSHIKEFTVAEMRNDMRRLNHWLPSGCLIAHLGGGNMGNQWMNEERLHRQLLECFPQNHTVIFPQTIYYTPDEAGQMEQARSIPIYNNKKNLTLVAREQTSYEIMERLYPDTCRLLIPDIVLSATMETFCVAPSSRDGVLLCLRSDAERSMTDEARTDIESILQKFELDYKQTDMYCEGAVTKENRAERVKQKMEEFVSAKLVITDRLHGMIFAAITGTPCIVFSNYNHKVWGTYEWIKYLPYIHYAETVADVEQYLPELLAMENCRYDNTPLMPYFEKLAQVVKAYAEN